MIFLRCARRFYRRYRRRMCLWLTMAALGADGLWQVPQEVMALEQYRPKLSETIGEFETPDDFEGSNVDMTEDYMEAENDFDDAIVDETADGPKDEYLITEDESNTSDTQREESEDMKEEDLSFEDEHEWDEMFASLSKSGRWNENLYNVAATQLGYESHVIGDDDRKSVSRYGVWFGDPSGKWSEYFTAFCMKYAGIPEEYRYAGTDPNTWMEVLGQQDLLIQKLEKVHQGDIAFLDMDLDGQADHTGIVAEIQKHDVRLIEGDVNSKVSMTAYGIDDGCLLSIYSVFKASGQMTDTDDGEEMEEKVEQYDAAGPDTVNVTAIKRWSDGSALHLHDSVTVQLYADGVPMEEDEYTVELNKKNQWTYVWKELPKTEGQGYAIKELTEHSGYTPSYRTVVEKNEGDKWLRTGQVTNGGTVLLTFGENVLSMRGDVDGMEKLQNVEDYLEGQADSKMKWEVIADGSGYFLLKNQGTGHFLYFPYGEYYPVTTADRSQAAKLTLQNGVLTDGQYKIVWNEGWGRFYSISSSGSAYEQSCKNISLYMEEKKPQEVICTVENKRNSSGAGGGPINWDAKDPIIRKWVDDQGKDDRYDLHLSVEAPDALTGLGKLDILFIIDTTGSMTYSMNGSRDNSKERWRAIEDSITSLTEKLERSQVDTRYAMAAFASGGAYASFGVTGGKPYGDAGYLIPWTDQPSAIRDRVKLEGEWLGGGTNYEAAFYLLNQRYNEMMGSARADARKVIIFITDGEPNCVYDEYGYTLDEYYSGVSSAEVAGNEASKLQGMDEFYAIGVGNEVGVGVLSQIAGRTHVPNGAFACRKKEELEEALFNSITKTMINCEVNGIWIEDKLSKNAEVTEDASLVLYVNSPDGKQYYAEGLFKDGAELTLPSTSFNPKGAVFTAKYHSGSKKITVETHGLYKLEPGWTYGVTTEIQPTASAYSTYAKTHNYPDVGAADTGLTSDGKPGFKSNVDESARFHYTDKDGKKDPEFPRPVIQTEAMAELPETGGIGDRPSMMAGLVLLIFAAMMICKKKTGKGVLHKSN